MKRSSSLRASAGCGNEEKVLRRHTFSEEAQLRVEIDRKTGDYRTFRQWTVVADEDHEMPACQDAISDVDPSKWSIGDVRELEVESIEFGRIAAQIAKQVIVQKIREAERALVADAYESKVGELIYGEVKKQTKDGFIIDLGDNAEAYLAREETIHKKRFYALNSVLMQFCIMSIVKVVVHNYYCLVPVLKC